VAPRRTELLIGLAGAAAAGGASALWGHAGGSVAIAALLGAALGAAPRHPRATWVFAALVMLATAPLDDFSLFGHEQGGGSLTDYLLVSAHAFCAARWDGKWAGVAALLVVTGASEVLSAFAHDSPGFWAAPIAGWGAGRALAEREHVAAQLAERARELEEEREAHAALSVRYERARIASELHDIVAHAISVMVVQASAGQRLAAHDPELTAETFAAIAGAAREAEGDIGRLVALLGDEGAIGPAPDLALVEELVKRAAGSGLDVTLRLEGEREGLPAPLGQAAYRVVQEGLTNALRYASGAGVSVFVRGGREALVVEVLDAGATDEAALTGTGTGNGLRGLRERVGACGGTLEAGPTPDGGWRLSARLPRRVSTGAA
jgi:signal transduction histidine kinase